MTAPGPSKPDRYVAPDGLGDRLTQRVIGRLVRMGIGALGARELRIVGRRSGQVRSVVVNLMDLDGERYLVAPRGVTHWVRNLRSAGGGELRLGRKVERFTARELPDDRKGPVLREYLRRWGWEVGRFFEGIDASASDADLARIAPGFPVFTIEPPAGEAPFPEG